MRWELKMKNIIADFIKNESGATAIEYGLIAGLVSVALIAGASSMGNTINQKLNFISTKVGNSA